MRCISFRPQLATTPPLDDGEERALLSILPDVLEREVGRGCSHVTLTLTPLTTTLTPLTPTLSLTHVLFSVITPGYAV